MHVSQRTTSECNDLLSVYLQVRLNFEVSMNGIMGQLGRLREILEVVDEPLHDKLKQVGVGSRHGPDLWSRAIPCP